MKKEEKIKALMEFFGISQTKAENQLEDMGEIDYGERKTKPSNERKERRDK